MSQHDYVIANDSGASVRADLNSLFQAILSQNSGTSEPSSTTAGTFWLDTTGGAPYTLKIRDAGNNHWLTLASITDPGSDGNLSVSAIEGTNVLSTGESGGNKFLREDGDGSCSWQSSGKILQVVNATSGAYENTTSTSFTATSLGLDITPTSTSSKIFLVTHASTFAGSGYARYTIYRDSTTNISGNARGYAATGSGTWNTTCFSCVDSPSTTSQVNYKVYFLSTSGGSNNVYWTDSDLSSLTAMEIGP